MTACPPLHAHMQSSAPRDRPNLQSCLGIEAITFWRETFSLLALDGRVSGAAAGNRFAVCNAMPHCFRVALWMRDHYFIQIYGWYGSLLGMHSIRPRTLRGPAATQPHTDSVLFSPAHIIIQRNFHILLMSGHCSQSAMRSFYGRQSPVLIASHVILCARYEIYEFVMCSFGGCRLQ